MTAIIVSIVLLLTVGALWVVLPTVGEAFVKWRGRRIVTCPETRQPAAVQADAAHAAYGALFGRSELRLQACSRWPERRDCGQECLRQIEEHPENCWIRNMVKSWYSGKVCALCREPIDTGVFNIGSVALMSPERVTQEWWEIPAEQLPGVFRTHQPLCWNCHIAEKFRRVHPDLVLERPSRVIRSAERGA